MSYTVHFDTLAYANKLKQAGVPDKQAEAQSGALAEIFDEQTATKKDLQDMEMRLTATLRADMSEMKADIIKWGVGLLFIQATLLVSLLKIFHS